MYTIIGSPRSRAMRVYWAMEEMGLKYDMNPVAPRAPEVLAYTSSGKVPCLLVDGDIITDSVAIIQFLADRHGQLSAPAGTIARATQDSVTQFTCDEIDGPLWTAAKHSFVLPKNLRLPAAKDAAKFEFARAMQSLETRLGDKQFITGDKITVPDIILGHCGLWAGVADFDVPKGRLTAYFARLAARPAFVKIRRMGDALPSVLPKEP